MEEPETRLLLCTAEPPAAQSNQCPHAFNHPKWPCASEPAVDGRGGTSQRENQHPPGRALFQGVCKQHDGHCARAKKRQIIHYRWGKNQPTSPALPKLVQVL